MTLNVFKILEGAVEWLNHYSVDTRTGISTVFTESEIDAIKTEATNNLYDGATEKDHFDSVVMAIRVRIETGYRYSLLAGAFVELYHESKAFGHLNPHMTYDIQDLANYPNIMCQLKGYRILAKRRNDISDQGLEGFLCGDVVKGVTKAWINYRKPMTLIGIQTLVDRYFLRDTSCDQVYETRLTMFFRVISGITRASRYGDNYASVFIDRFEKLLKMEYLPSTPTLFNSGTNYPQLSSCYLSTVPDALDGIFGTFSENAALSKFAGGIGNDFTPVRALGSYIESTRGQSQGVIPFLKVNESTAIAVNQGGKRKGAICAYLEAWHLDFFDFMDLRKNTGDERRRTHDMNIASWIPDLLVLRKDAGTMWSFFSPNEVPDLHDLYGEEFEKRYCEYEQMGLRGELKQFRQVPAVDVWRKNISMLFETGHPWICYKDPCNIRNPQSHVGVVHSSNLCTEITLNTSEDEVAVCNLGSINLVAIVDPVTRKIDWTRLDAVVKTAIGMLDDVIDENFYPSPRAKNSNMRHRPVGLGVMGFQDMLSILGVANSSPDAFDLAYAIQAFISLAAIQASSSRARTLGKYESYKGSTWDQDIFPIDTYSDLMDYRENRGYPVQRTLYIDTYTDPSGQKIPLGAIEEDVREQVAKHGMRNSNLTSIAPTATISNIAGVSQSIEPTYQNLYVKSNLSGEFTIINPYLEKALRDLEMWGPETVMLLKMNDGSVQLPQFPSDIQELFKTAFEVNPNDLIDAAGARQVWLDQSQSLNIYAAKPNGPLLDAMYTRAFAVGCKTTYYLRALGATQAEKSTGQAGALNAVKISGPKACSIDNPDCEACQ